MQREITKPDMLLDKNGKLNYIGYATSPLLKFSRSNVKNKHRLKEWDYYLIFNKEYAVTLTVGKTLNLLIIGFSITDMKEGKVINKYTIRIAPGKFQLPTDCEKGNIFYKDKFIRLAFKNEGCVRILLLKKYNLKKVSDLDISLVLYNEPKDSMVFAAPFAKDRKQFCYARKIIGMKASGYVRYRDKNYGFSPIDSYAVINWSRGVFPYKTSWYWGSAVCKIHGKIFGFNLGYGSVDSSYATENMLFYGGNASKLDHVAFLIPQKSKNDYDYLKPWTITSSDNRIEMIFVPVVDRKIIFPIIPFPLSVKKHQVFGKFTGRAILDDGTVIYLKEVTGFAEKTDNRW